MSQIYVSELDRHDWMSPIYVSELDRRDLMSPIYVCELDRNDWMSPIYVCKLDRSNKKEYILYRGVFFYSIYSFLTNENIEVVYFFNSFSNASSFPSSHVLRCA